MIKLNFSGLLCSKPAEQESCWEQALGKGTVKSGFGVTAARLVSVLLGLLALPALAQQGTSAAALLDAEHDFVAPSTFSPFPLVHTAASGGLSFDLGGSEEQKLQLRLAQPLFIGTGFQARQPGLAGSEISLGSTLGWLATDELGIAVSAAETSVASPFRSLGSIHCENGVLAADSYTASGCYFIDQPGTARLSTLSLGAGLDMTDNASASVSIFRQESVNGSPVRGFSSADLALPLMSLPGALSAPQPQNLLGQPLDYLQSEVTGIDLEFQLGIATSRAGDLRLGLQLTRILGASYDGHYRDGSSFRDWTLSEPADSARISFDWRKGSFSGGVESYYRAPMEFMSRGDLDSVTTFDVHFTWRTPWNANLSVGASNLLNSGADEGGVSDATRVDPFESVYGRIPYVRYQQDL
jgi:hypothetical protein